ncbi:hypothetical protein KKA85_05660 [bacterium]|nr:hypothetical protein [bacterium]MBU1675249.1 hypothetical protein [bacterium]
MRHALLLLFAPLLLPLAGCDTTFPGEEMDVAGGRKTRPFAIVCEPPEAAPGETVTVTLHYYEPEPDRHDVSWRVSLDYDLGLYEADEVERDIVELDGLVNPPQSDAYGFCTQAFTYTVPDEALLRASSQPEVITDELLLALARPLLDLAEDDPLSKTELDLRLALTAAGQVSWEYVVDDNIRAMWGRLGDLFACEIRFRAGIDGAVRVDVTKNLTVRYSSNLESVNVNQNPRITRTYIRAAPYPDVAYEDLFSYGQDVLTFGLTAEGWYGDLVEIPLHADWTYYLDSEVYLQDYTSPFDADIRLEKFNLHWYHYNLDDPGVDRPLFVRDDGDEAEMDDLDRWVRLLPPAHPGHLGYRVATCMRDVRMEWRGYAFAPGANLVYSEFAFVEP